jgi:hypothetical protein
MRIAQVVAPFVIGAIVTGLAAAQTPAAPTRASA